MEQRIAGLLAEWERRNIRGSFVSGRQEAAQAVLGLIPHQAAVGFSGSVTLHELGIIRLLEERGNKVFDPYKSGLSREESLELRKQGAQAEVFLASANAVSQTGQLVFLSAVGNRTSGIAYARQVIAVCGINKIVPTLPEALRRAREYATPRNCKRLGWNTPCAADGVCRDPECRFPVYKRMCAQTLIIEAEVELGRFNVVLVDESLGY